MAQTDNPFKKGEADIGEIFDNPFMFDIRNEVYDFINDAVEAF